MRNLTFSANFNFKLPLFRRSGRHHRARPVQRARGGVETDGRGVGRVRCHSRAQGQAGALYGDADGGILHETWARCKCGDGVVVVGARIGGGGVHARVVVRNLRGPAGGGRARELVWRSTFMLKVERLRCLKIVCHNNYSITICYARRGSHATLLRLI